MTDEKYIERLQKEKIELANEIIDKDNAINGLLDTIKELKDTDTRSLWAWRVVAIGLSIYVFLVHILPSLI